MSSSKSESGTRACEVCGRAGTEEYVHGAERMVVCQICKDRWEIQDAYENGILEIHELEQAGKTDEALAVLDSILAANRDRDQDGWLRHGVRAYRAIVLRSAGRYIEAEQEWRARAQLPFANVGERWEVAHGLAGVLRAQGRYREAVEMLEDGLSHQEERELPNAPRLLGELARYSLDLGQPVDPRWLDLARAAAESCGVDLPAGNSVAEVLLALDANVAGASARDAQQDGEGPVEELGDSAPAVAPRT
jgi:tetratricopeptide (TPR) repeat protein